MSSDQIIALGGLIGSFAIPLILLAWMFVGVNRAKKRVNQ